MSNFKDKLKSTQGGGNNYPKLPIVKTFEMKEDESSSDVAFCSYNKESQSNEFRKEPITGIFIGAAMVMSSYSDSLGRNGGQYKSEHYVNNSHPMALFAPNGQKYEVVCKGSAKEIETFIDANSTGNAKKRQVLYVLTSAGLIAVLTNLSIAIDQIGTNREALQEKFIVLTPKVFEESADDISKKAKDFLGKFRTKNPPKYASVSLGMDITDELWGSLGGDAATDAYAEWKKFKEAGGAIEEKKEETVTTNKSSHELPPPVNYTPTEDDDLPF